MQPYFYPYLGYFKLIQEVDTFVFLTNVQYKRRGWINRNRIRSPHSSFTYLTIPVCKAPIDTCISDIKIDNSTQWHSKHCKTLESVFGNRLKDNALYNHYKTIEIEDGLSSFREKTIKYTSSHLGISTHLVDQANLDLNLESYIDFSLPNATQRIIAICKAIGADTYVNLSGGASLYEQADFMKHNVKLQIMENFEFHNSFSVLDVCISEGLTSLNGI